MKIDLKEGALHHSHDMRQKKISQAKWLANLLMFCY